MVMQHREFIRLTVDGVEKTALFTLWSDGYIRWYVWEPTTKKWKLRYIERHGSK